MIGFNHALAGALIAVTVPPTYVPLVALASHFVMDAFPHFGKSEIFKPYTRSFKALLVFDAMMCFAVLGCAWWLFSDRWVLVTLGIFFATLPDFLWLIERKVTWASSYFSFARRIQRGESPDGWTYELLTFCLLAVAVALVA